MEQAPETGTGDNTLTSGFTPGESAAPTEQGQAPAAPTSWHSDYSADFQGLMEKKGLGGLSQQEATESLAKSYTNLESMRNVKDENLYNVSSDMSDESREDLFTAMGRPESADKYSYETQESDSPELVDAFKAASHGLGLTDKQVAGLIPQVNETIASLVNESTIATQAINNEGLTALQKEWGGAWEANKGMATRAAEYFGINEEMQLAIVGSGQSAGFLKALNTMGGLMAEGAMAGMSPQSGSASMGVMTPAAATAEINSKLGDKDFMARYHSQNQATRLAASKELEPFRKAQTAR
jgi:hypothetical protein